MRRRDEIEREIEDADLRPAAPAVMDNLMSGEPDQAQILARFEQMTERDKQAGIAAREQAAFEKALADIAKLEGKHVSESNRTSASAGQAQGQSRAQERPLALTEPERRAAQAQTVANLQRAMAESLEDAHAQKRPVSIVQAAPRSNQGQDEDKHADEGDRLATRKAAQARAEADFQRELQRVLTESFEAAQAQKRPVSIVQAAPRSNQGQDEDKHADESDRLATRQAVQAQERPVSMIFSGAPGVQQRKPETTSPVAAQKPATPAAAPTPAVEKKDESEAAKAAREAREARAAFLVATEKRAADAKAAKAAKAASTAVETKPGVTSPVGTQASTSTTTATSVAKTPVAKTPVVKAAAGKK